jgi:hypothetical protein
MQKNVFCRGKKCVSTPVNLASTLGAQGVWNPLFFLVLFERGRRGADGAAASAFGFSEGAAGSSILRTCFFVVKKEQK